MKKRILNTTMVVLSISFLLVFGAGNGVVLAADYYIDASLGTDDPIHGGSLGIGAWKTITYSLGQVTGSEGNPIILNVAAGSYSRTSGETLPLMMKDYVSLQGAGPETSIIDGENHVDGVVIISDSINNYFISGFSIVRGWAAGDGIGMSCLSSSPSIINCFFSSDGMGIYNDNSSPSIINCNFTENENFATGAGIFNSNGSSPFIANCIFNNNFAEYFGGAIMNSSSSPTIINSIFVGNLADYDGGGAIYNGNSSPHIINCSFFGNIAGSGFGGAIYNVNSSPTITNCILWGNAALTGPEIYNDVDSNPIITFCNVDQDGYGNPGGSADSNGNIRLDPLFVDPVNGDLHIQSGSPCIDTGTLTSPLVDDDIDGESRPFGSGIDMGADEHVPMCQGNFDFDTDVDGSDAHTFKQHFGRSTFKNPCPLDGPAPVSRTGQETDGRRGVIWPEPRFLDNNDGTVKDNLTGLMWSENANVAGSIMNYNETLNFIAMMNNLVAFGYNDWRVPNIKELLSLIDYSAIEPPLTVGHPFINVQTSHNYWTATNNDLMWVGDMLGVQFLYGSVTSLESLDAYYVWPVRGGH